MQRHRMHGMMSVRDQYDNTSTFPKLTIYICDLWMDWRFSINGNKTPLQTTATNDDRYWLQTTALTSSCYDR